MTINTELYDKLELLDKVQGESIVSLQAVREEINREARGYDKTLSDIVDGHVPGLINTDIALLAAAFAEGGVLFSPQEVVSEARNSQTVFRTQAQIILQSNDVTTFDELLQKEKDALTAFQGSQTDADRKRAQRDAKAETMRSIVAFNADPSLPFKLAPENVEQFTGRVDRWRWLREPAYRAARAAISGIKDPKSALESKSTLDHGYATAEAERQKREEAYTKVSRAVRQYRELEAKMTTDTVARNAIMTQTRQAVRQQRSMVMPVAMLLPAAMRTQFIEAALRLYGLGQLLALADREIAALEDARDDIDPALKKLRVAKKRKAFKTARASVSAEQIDRAILATRARTQHVCDNLRHACAQTRNYRPSRTALASITAPARAPADTEGSDFNAFYALYMLYMLNESGTERSIVRDAFASDAQSCAVADFGHEALQKLAPDYSATLDALTQEAGYKDMIGDCRIDFSDLDAGASSPILSGDFGAAAQQTDAVPSGGIGDSAGSNFGGDAFYHRARPDLGDGVPAPEFHSRFKAPHSERLVLQ
ncbi:MAG: hypothetical protein H6865_08050 [Rhodospirillales bacterium]|nr:hypothetical protein [Alphaproteobacteria bacterium]MCB9987568.1 hypothetical protein [Rhodospirillales bacterium]USO07712.1 MAG: hypothetical protein H6866_00300 [Rhodospirillales bacterium]